MANFNETEIATRSRATAHSIRFAIDFRNGPRQQGFLVDDCKKGGWQTFDSPSFKNHGDCVSFVANGGKD